MGRGAGSGEGGVEGQLLRAGGGLDLVDEGGVEGEEGAGSGAGSEDGAGSADGGGAGGAGEGGGEERGAGAEEEAGGVAGGAVAGAAEAVVPGPVGAWERRVQRAAGAEVEGRGGRGSA